MALTTLADAKTYMGVTSSAHDAEITRYVNQADGVVHSLAGPTAIRGTYVDDVTATGREVFLPRYPVVSVDEISTFDGTAYVVSTETMPVISDTSGLVSSSFATSTRLRVTYTAGLATVPDEFADAALVFVSYKYRRNHGGSESYMPAGVDAGVAPPMGANALRDQIRLALGEYAGSTPSIA